MDKKIKTLRTFFRVSNAVFEFQNSIQLAFSGHIVPSKMHQLHKIALFEIEKETPDLSLIDKLLAEMENSAEQIEPKPNFPKGGVITSFCNCKGGAKGRTVTADFEHQICEQCGKIAK